MDIEAGTKVWDVVECNTCNFPCYIYLNYVLNISKLELSGAEQKKLVDKLEAYKDSYVCSDACPIDHFETKRILRCSDFVETQYFTFGKGKNNWNLDTCCYCCWPDNLLTIDKIKEEFDY